MNLLKEEGILVFHAIYLTLSSMMEYQRGNENM